MGDQVLRLEGVGKTYGHGHTAVQAVVDATFHTEPGHFLVEPGYRLLRFGTRGMLHDMVVGRRRMTKHKERR